MRYFHVTKKSYFTKTYTPAEWFRDFEDSDEALLFTTAWGKLYRKDLFRNIRYPEGMKMEDAYTTYLTYLLANRITFVNEPLYVYRINENSIMNTASEIEKKPLDCLEEECILLSMLGMDARVVKKRYYNRLHIHKEQLLRGQYRDNNYHKIMSYLEILRKYGYKPD